jgi:hypothetical protein
MYLSRNLMEFKGISKNLKELKRIKGIFRNWKSHVMW